MFANGSKLILVDHLVQRDASLLHACQLNDLPSYFKLGGIPSHAHLETHRSRFTPMDTDAVDKVNGVWDKVFINLADFGRVFAMGGCATPTCYGPINIQMHPNALLEAEDVAVCLRSAGAQGFNRQRESLTALEEVESLFRYSARKPFPLSLELKQAEELREAFPNAHWPELSCTVQKGYLSLKHTIVVWVDPYSIDGSPLVDRVRILARHHGLRCPVVERSCHQERRPLYNELAGLAMTDTHTIDKALALPGISAELRAFLFGLQERDLEYQFDRYLRYLGAGTLAVNEVARGVSGSSGTAVV